MLSSFFRGTAVELGQSSLVVEVSRSHTIRQTDTHTHTHTHTYTVALL